MEPALTEELDGLWINAMFFLEDPCTEGLFRIIGKNWDNGLYDDGALITLLIDEVNCTARKSNPGLHCLALHMESWKCREQRGVDVHDSVRKGVDKISGEKTHETGQDDQLHLSDLESFNQVLIKGLTRREFTMVDYFGRDSMLLGPNQTIGIRAITDHHTNLGIELLFLNGIDDRLEIAAVTRDQYSQRDLARHGFRGPVPLPSLLF